VWSLRVGYVALLVAFAGLASVLMGATPWVLAAGVITWLAAAAVTLVEFLVCRHEYAGTRPGLWRMRLLLIHDTVHALPSPGGPDSAERSLR